VVDQLVGVSSQTLRAPNSTKQQQTKLVDPVLERSSAMLRDKSQELPSSFTPQWMLNRAGAGAGGTDTAAAGTKQQQAPSASPAAGREGKWVADRWGPTEKEADSGGSKWGHDPFDRPRWTEDEERGLGGGRLPRDTGRCVLLMI